LWKRFVYWLAWPIYRRSRGYRWLHKWLTDKGYTLTEDRTWHNHKYEVEPCGLWTCTSFHVYRISDNSHAGWTILEGASFLEDGIGL
jgi:hypothetical protein